MRPVALSLTFAIAACASSPTLGSGPATQTIRTAGSSTGLAISPTTSIVTKTIPLPVDQVWRALPGVYASLGIPLTTVDQKTHTIGNEGLKLRQELGSVPLSMYIDCGTTQTGPNADSYDVLLIVLTQLTPGDPRSTKMTTTFDASAKPAALAQDYSHCSTRGVLESRLVDSVLTRLRR